MSDTRKLACPGCKENAGVKIAYGHPGDEMFEAAEKGEIALGGCVQMHGAPNRKCLACGREW